MEAQVMTLEAGRVVRMVYLFGSFALSISRAGDESAMFQLSVENLVSLNGAKNEQSCRYEPARLSTLG